MSTDTPRTDNILGALVERGIELREGTCPEVLVTEMRKMERELNEAKARVARLEEAGDNLLYYCKYVKPRDEWRKAKL